MKPSHLTTPRTLSETSFVTGYVSVRPMAERHYRLKNAAWAVAGVAVFALWGVLLAWRG